MNFVINPFVFVATGGSGNGPDSTDYYVEVTIQSAEVGATLTDFPVYVNLADLPAGFWASVQSDGGDIRVTESDGTTRAPAELVNISTIASTGELWFLASSLSSSANTTYRLYYGYSGAGTLSQPTVGDTYGRNAVWADYEHVWHLSEANDADDAVDATGSLDLDANGDPLVQTGKLGGGRRLSGSGSTPTEYFDTATTAGPSTPAAVTMQMWHSSSYTGATGNQYFQYGNRWAFQRGAGQTFMGFSVDGSFADPIAKSATGVFNGALRLYHGAFGSGTTTLYVDGSASATTASQTLGAIGGLSRQLVSLGVNSVDASPAQNDTMDEVRVRFSALSSDWVASEYSNQNTPTTFYSVGTQQTA